MPGPIVSLSRLSWVNGVLQGIYVIQIFFVLLDNMDTLITEVLTLHRGGVWSEVKDNLTRSTFLDLCSISGRVKNRLRKSLILIIICLVLPFKPSIILDDTVAECV